VQEQRRTRNRAGESQGVKTVGCYVKILQNQNSRGPGRRAYAYQISHTTTYKEREKDRLTPKRAGKGPK